MRLSLTIALMAALLPGGSTIMPVWSTPDVMPPARMEAEALAPVPMRQREIARDVRQDSGTNTAYPGTDFSRTDFRRLRLAGPFPAVVTDVIDGDSFEAKVTIWLGHEVTTRVRLLGIDAAEMGSECREERELAVASRAALRDMLAGPVELRDVRFDKYGGRVLARAGTSAHRDISDAMLAGGHAIHYEGGRRQAWCEPVVTSRR